MNLATPKGYYLKTTKLNDLGVKQLSNLPFYQVKGSV